MEEQIQERKNRVDDRRCAYAYVCMTYIYIYIYIERERERERERVPSNAEKGNP